MGQPESHTRPMNVTHARIHHEEIQASAIEPTPTENQTAQKQLTPEEIERAFLQHYSKFIGTDLNNKTTWRSETFSQTQDSDLTHYDSNKMTP